MQFEENSGWPSARHRNTHTSEEAMQHQRNHPVQTCTQILITILTDMFDYTKMCAVQAYIPEI